MLETTIYTRQSNAEIRALVARIPAILAGDEPDRAGMRLGLQLRVGYAFLSFVKAAFVVKARGGTDEGGESWAPLSPAYLAYGRGPKSTRTAGGLSPGGKDGFMSPADLKRWRSVFRQMLAIQALAYGPDAARDFQLTADEVYKRDAPQAAATAWIDAKERGVKTKLAVFGSRPHEILRDRGILLNSLSPGIVVTERDAAASGLPPSYTRPGGEGGEQQVMRAEPGALIVGTSVAYAAAHHYAKPPRIRRRLWPETLPASWAASIARTAARGLGRALGKYVRGGQL